MKHRNRSRHIALSVMASVIFIAGLVLSTHASNRRDDANRSFPGDQRGSETPDPAGLYLLGSLHYPGMGRSTDLQKTVRYWRHAAELGHSRAQRSLGILHEAGTLVPRDPAQAAHWYRKAATQGDILAQFQLGLMHASGEGIPRDPAQAIAWLEKAALGGAAPTRSVLDSMAFTGLRVPDHIMMRLEQNGRWAGSSDDPARPAGRDSLVFKNDGIRP